MSGLGSIIFFRGEGPKFVIFLPQVPFLRAEGDQEWGVGPRRRPGRGWHRGLGPMAMPMSV